MNRRGFLSLLGMSAAGLAVGGLDVDVERLLWLPGAKRIFLPSAPTWRPEWTQGSTFLTPDLITREALRVLEHQLHFLKAISGEYDGPVRSGRAIQMLEAKPFITVNARTPLRFSGLSDPETWT
jgi:hypothetical protein